MINIVYILSYRLFTWDTKYTVIQLHETNCTTSIILTMPGLHGLYSSSLFSIFSAYLEYPMSKTGSTSAMRSWATDSCEGRFNGSQLLNVIQLPQSACRFKVSSSKFTVSFLCSTIHAIRIQRYFSHWSHSDSNQTIFHPCEQGLISLTYSTRNCFCSLVALVHLHSCHLPCPKLCTCTKRVNTPRGS